MTSGSAGDIPVKAIAEAVLERARRTGLLWRLRPATVTAVSAAGIRVRLDGDTETIRTASMVGDVIIGARVMILITPPAGQHIVGWAGTPAAALGPDALAYTDTDSDPVTATTVVLSTPIRLRAHTAYRVELGGAATGTGDAPAQFRLRHAARNGRAPQPLTDFGDHPAAPGAVISIDGTTCYIRRNADTDLDTVIELTLETGAGTVLHAAPPGRCRYLQLTACGDAARFPHAITVE
jgi:hypothetical protein